MGTMDSEPRATSGRRGMVMVIVAVWTGWAVAVLVAPILKQAVEGSDGLGPSTLLSRGKAAGRIVRIPVHLPHRRKSGKGPEKMAKIVQRLADMYGMHCECAEYKACPCAKDAETRVKDALNNAVDREFAPPNMFYRSKNGYDIRQRGFQHAKTHMNGGLVHDKFLDIEPIRTTWRQPAMVRARTSSPSKKAKKKLGLPPIHVQGRFVNENVPRVDVYIKSHAAETSQPETDSRRKETAMRQQQTTKLWEFNYIPLADEEFPGKHPTLFEAEAAKEDYLDALAAACREDAALDACKELTKEGEEEDEGGGAGAYQDSWFDAFLDYAKPVLEDGELEERKAASGVAPPPQAAFAIPYQEGQEADYADWLYATDDDVVRPLRLVEGESNFPEMDANVNAPGAVLEDYAGQAGAGESYASFLKHPAGEGGAMQADASSVNGWLTDESGY